MLDGQHLWIVDSLPQKVEHTVKTFKRLVYRNIALLEAFKKRLTLHQLRGVARLVRREQQLGVIDQINNLRQTHEVDGTMHAVQGEFWQVELFEQKA